MNRLNYFNSYSSKDENHEDQLTRAYLVLLKHSSHTFFAFMEYCRSKQIISDTEKPISFLEFLEDGWEIETQKGNPIINTRYLLSILITDSQIPENKISVQSSERNARYDGVLTFGDKLTMVVENKPRSGNVWFEQLNPSRQNLAEETVIYSTPIILEWKEIIKQLSLLLNLQTISGNEKLMIEDFLYYIDDKFAYLNPFDSFHQCKGNVELLNRRICNLLKSISLDENKVKYHKGWGFCIQTPYQQIQQIGLILEKEENEWWLELSLYFGDTQTQAKSFYKSNPDISKLKNTDWQFNPNFHVSFMTSNLVWFQTNKENIDLYLKFWGGNIEHIYQHKKEDIPTYLKWLVDEKVINTTKEIEEKMDEKFYKTAMQSLNICPGFGFRYYLTSSEVERLDKEKKLGLMITDKIKEVLDVVGLDVSYLLK
jgi:hypothetical protein